MTRPYKFVITIKLRPGTRDEILARAPKVQAATRAEPGCLTYDFFTCTDDPDVSCSWRRGRKRLRMTSTCRGNIRSGSSPSTSNFTGP